MLLRQPLLWAMCLLAWGIPHAQATSLQDILKNNLFADPAILEAQANQRVAAADIKIAQSAHYPTVTVTGAQTLAQNHRYDGNRRSSFNPGLQGKLNLYSWGGKEAQIRQAEHKHDYFQHKVTETQEDVSNTIATLYLGALRAKESIQAAQHNLERHNQIINDLTIITKFDKGRMSELEQAMARRLRVDAYLAEQTRSLELNLSKLGKYTGSRLAPELLQNPFEADNPDNLVARFQMADARQQPSYQAQQAERQSVEAELDVAKANRYPDINLIANVNRDNKEVYVNLEWDIYNRARGYQVSRTAESMIVADAKMEQIQRDVAERARSAQVDMLQSLKRVEIGEQQIAAQKKVIKAYELQFKIARRTLIDVLDAYAELWNIENTVVAARNDYRDAALAYLNSQAAIGKWAGVVNVDESGSGSPSQPPTQTETQPENPSND
ncbi:TolC family protein [Alysiella filiformis]|uniref:Outer membrane protein, adhesin transport system n=1 Tax=Alysiella filiformis DSM 16848 TaxID=1120981 RepID=A0A286EE45_9NEIS|nr:TolC family protein [Alysiella filiformis]QMT30939.1 TolC family protein [Alysiella filiformis]UBQ56073.1 TolC family protein [Alysiella filiformis DSM 16848]SOD69177.1 outer membrane protein, adhesin transport system [Alysiella filiformis DSM 16848]